MSRISEQPFTLQGTYNTRDLGGRANAAGALVRHRRLPDRLRRALLV